MASNDLVSSVALGSSVIFIDPRVADYPTLLQRRVSEAQVVVLDPAEDGIAQISAYLAEAEAVESVHIVSHGAAGWLQLGNTALSALTLASHAEAIRAWAIALKRDADILLYGCEVAAQAIGRSLVQRLAHLTGANVAASSTLVGAAALGGNWELDYTLGTVKTAIAFHPAALQAYPSVLAAFGSGNIVVVRIGDGNAFASTRTLPVFLDEYTTTGTLVQSIAMPVADSGTQNALTLSSRFQSNGTLSLSADGQYLTLVGIDTAQNGLDINLPATIALVDGLGNVDTTTTLAADGSLPVGSVATIDGSQLWVTGQLVQPGQPTQGVIRLVNYGTNNTNATLVATDDGRVRAVEFFNGQLYGASDQAGNRPLNTIATSNVAFPTTVNVLPGQETNPIRNSTEFVLLDRDATVAGLDTAYVASFGGIFKYSFNGTTWQARGSFSAGVTARGFDWIGLTGLSNGSTVELFVVQGSGLGNSSLLRVTDIAAFNQNFSGNAITLADAGANTTFRGVSFVPGIPTVSLAILDAIAGETETGNTATLRIERTSFAAAMTVVLSLGGTASAADYTLNQGTLQGSTLTITIPAGQRFVDVVLTATPDAVVEGNETLEFSLLNGGYQINPTANAAILTILDNRTPIGQADTYQVDEDAPPLVVNAAQGVLSNDSDADNNSLSVSLVTGVQNGTLVLNANGSFTYTPNANFSGVDQFTYRISDGFIQSQPVTVTLNVNPTPDAPIARPDAYTLDEDAVLTVNAANGILANDSDADGDALTIVLLDDVDNGTLVLNENGSFIYTPNANFNGVEQFTYQISDGLQVSQPVTVTLTVNPVPDTPIARPDTYTLDEDTVLTVNAASGILVNDSDADGDALTIVLLDDVDNGTLVLNDNGSFVYTPNTNFNGVEQFTYQISDGLGVSRPVTVTLNVNPTPDAPIARPDAYTLDEDTVLTVNAANGILANDSDADGDALTIVLLDDVDSGTLVLNENGSFSYRPNADFNGSDSFTYQLQDPSGALSAPVNVQLTVNSILDRPQALDDRYTLLQRETLVVGEATGVLQNDRDGDGDPLTVRLVTGPQNGQLTLNPDGSFVYTPVGTFRGLDQFTYVVNDGSADSAVARVVLDVGATNQPPTVGSPIQNQVTLEDRPFNFQLPANAFVDQDGDPLTYRVVSQNGAALPNWLRFNPNTRRLAGTPDNSHVGQWNLRVIATDSAGEETSQNFQLRVLNTNDAPRVGRSPSNIRALVQRRFSFRLSENTFRDIDAGDRLRYTARLNNGQALPNWLQFQNNTLSFQGRPPQNAVGVYQVQVVARDLSGAQAVTRFTLRVLPEPSRGPDVGGNVILGTSWNDSDMVRGTEAGDRIEGLGGFDYIRGFGGNDLLLGGAQDDVLDGGFGHDILVGGTGNDVLFGNAGRDTFVVEPQTGTDRVMDFQDGLDRIGLRGLSFDAIRVVQGAGTTELWQANTNSLLMRLQGVSAGMINAADFVSY